MAGKEWLVEQSRDFRYPSNLGESLLHSLPTLHIPSFHIQRSSFDTNTIAAIVDTSTAPTIIGIVVISCHLLTGSVVPKATRARPEQPYPLNPRPSTSF